MTIQTITQSMSNTNYVGNTRNTATTQNNIQKFLPTGTLKNDELLSPEQKNTLQNNVNDKVAEQANNIKSNFQTAKDIDLTRAYYEQQQKLVDIYMQVGQENSSDNDLNFSATKALTDTYASLYQLHQTIKEGIQLKPENPENIRPIEEIIVPLTNPKTDSYNSFMMPTTNSYISLHA